MGDRPREHTMTAQTGDYDTPLFGAGMEYPAAPPGERCETGIGVHGRRLATIFVDTNVLAWLAENADPVAKKPSGKLLSALKQYIMHIITLAHSNKHVVNVGEETPTWFREGTARRSTAMAGSSRSYWNSAGSTPNAGSMLSIPEVICWSCSPGRVCR